MGCPRLVEFENKAATADIFPELPCSVLNFQLMLINGPQCICQSNRLLCLPASSSDVT